MKNPAYVFDISIGCDHLEDWGASITWVADMSMWFSVVYIFYWIGKHSIVTCSALGHVNMKQTKFIVSHVGRMRPLSSLEIRVLPSLVPKAVPDCMLA